MFRFNWLKKWESVYPNGFVPNNDHKFSSLRQFEKHSFIPCFQKISDYNTQNFEAQVYSYTYSCKDRVLFQKSTHESVTITEL